MKKKILSLFLCTTLAFASAITANAFQIDSSSFVDLKTEYNLPKNKFLQYAYNIDADHTGSVTYKTIDKELIARLDFKNCGETPKTIDFTPPQEGYYTLSTNAQEDVTGCTSVSKFYCDGGKYKKVRIKLSDFSKRFNENGEFLYDNNNNITIDFNKKYDSNGGYYDTFLVIKSAAAYNAVIPDENGEIEFYMSTNPLHEITLLMNIGENNSYYGITLDMQFGDVNKSGISHVSDVTQIQLALAGKVTLDDYAKFNADINLDGIYDIKDVTALQLALAKKNA